MAAANFPLFKPAIEEPPEDLPPSVSDLLDREVRRAALVGSAPDAEGRASMTLDLPLVTLDALQALARATGSSRRAMGGKLLDAAIWQAVNELARHAQGAQSLPEYEAVFSEWTDEFNALREARKEADE